MKTLVTGGAGFIGSTIVDALLARGDDVAVVDDLSRGYREQVPATVALHVVDITSPELRAVLLSERPEVVFHQAAQIDVRRSVREPLFDTQVNVVGTVNLLQACVDAGVRRVVFASSGGAIYGDTEAVPTPEQHPAAPASAYGAAKLCGETYGDVFHQLHGLEFVPLRYGNVYGPRQDPHGEAGVVAIFAERLLRGEECVINGEGTQTRDYVYVDDVVRANLLAAVTDELRAFNVGTGIETDVNGVFELLVQACDARAQAVHGPPKQGEQARSCLDIRAAAELLGWAPQMALPEGMRRTVDFFRERH